MRSYQIYVKVDSPLTLRRAGVRDDREEMFRYLNNMLGELSVEVDRFARARLEELRQTAAAAGYVLDIPSLAEPMGLAHGFTDVTGHIGQRWRGSSPDAEPGAAADGGGM